MVNSLILMTIVAAVGQAPDALPSSEIRTPSRPPFTLASTYQAPPSGAANAANTTSSNPPPWLSPTQPRFGSPVESNRSLLTNAPNLVAHSQSSVRQPYPGPFSEPETALPWPGQEDTATLRNSANFPEYDPDAFEWQLLPRDILYRPYLASQKESRLAAQIVNETDHDALFDGWLGGRFGLLRYGNRDPIYPLGMQVDIEGAGLVRLDIVNDVDVQSVDFRAGVPISIGWGRHQTRFGYYHLSSHTGDEFLLKNPNHQRLNFARDVLYIGHGYYLTPEFRLYGEAGWAFFADVAQDWEFQLGFDYAPRLPTGWRGSPFFGFHVHLREELDYSGGFTAQVGWAWRSDSSTGLFRMGLQYYNGASPQYSFYRENEQQVGFGIWYDN